MTRPQPALLLNRVDHIATVTFNRPASLNAFDVETARLFRDACTSIAEDPRIRVVILRGAGRAFCAGGDIGMFDKDPAGVPSRLIDPVHEGIERLGEIPAPVIGSVHGVVVGSGFSLALTCDLVIAAASTRFNLAYVNVGVSCDVGASWTLPRIVGLRKAMEIALLNPVLDAHEARTLGIVNRVVPDDELSERTTELASSLARKSPHALAGLKKLLLASSGRSFHDQLAAERESFGHCTKTPEFAAAVEKFLAARASSG